MIEQEIKFTLRRNSNRGDRFSSAIVGELSLGAVRHEKWEAIKAVCNLAMLHDRQTVENGAGRPRSERRENGRASCAEAVKRASSAYQVAFGRRREFPVEILVKFRPSQAEGGWWANATVGSLCAGARGSTRQAALVALAKSLASSEYFKQEKE